MSANDDKRIVEINGIKIEVDLRTAKRVDQYRIGDRVKVLIKNYDSYSSHHGVIVAFDEFENLPTITVCYISGGSYSPDIKFASINKQSKDVEIAPCNDDVIIDKEEIVRTLNNSIEDYQAKIHDLEAKRNYFLAKFGELFSKENK